MKQNERALTLLMGIKEKSGVKVFPDGFKIISISTCLVLFIPKMNLVRELLRITLPPVRIIKGKYLSLAEASSGRKLVKRTD